MGLVCAVVLFPYTRNFTSHRLSSPRCIMGTILVIMILGGNVAMERMGWTTWLVNKTLFIYNGNRSEWNPIRSVII